MLRRPGDTALPETESFSPTISRSPQVFAPVTPKFIEPPTTSRPANKTQNAIVQAELNSVSLSSKSFGPGQAVSRLGAFSGRQKGVLETSALKGIQMGLMTSERIQAMSVVTCSQSTITDRNSLGQTLMDPAMGVKNRATECLTCHGNFATCPFHGAGIHTWWPFSHPFLIDFEYQLRRVLCMCCGRLLVPITPQIRAEQMALPPQKRLANFAKKVKGVTFCGSPVQQEEELASFKAIKAAEVAAQIALEAAAEAKAIADAQAATLAAAALKKEKAAARSQADAVRVLQTEHPDEEEMDNSDEENVEDAEGDDVEDPEGNEESDPDAVDEDLVAIDGEDDGLVANLEDDEEDPAAALEDMDGANDDLPEDREDEDDGAMDLDDGDDDGDEEGGGRRRGKKRKATKKKKDKKKKKRKTPKAIALAKKPRDFMKLVVGRFDPKKLDTHGCGAPVPILRRDGLRIYAKYRLMFTGDNDKRHWAKYNAWIVYSTFRAMRSEDQEILGFNWETSPPRALMPKDIYISHATASKTGDFNSGHSVTPDQARVLSDKRTSAQAHTLHFGKKDGGRAVKDDNKQEVKDVQSKVNRFHQRLEAMDIQTHEEMPSQFRRIEWMLPNSNRIVPCICKNEHFCECILIATKQHDKLASVQEYERGLALMNASKTNASGGNVSTGGNSLASMRRVKSSQKEIETLQQDVETTFTILTIGDINRKGAGRKGDEDDRHNNGNNKKKDKHNEKPQAGGAVAGAAGKADEPRSKQNSWQAGASTQNSAQLKDNAIAHNLVGKKGLIRHNVVGKRVEKNGRTVASGSQTLEVDEVGVPKEMAEKLTVGEKLQHYNKAFLMDQLRSGKIEIIISIDGEMYHSRILGRDTHIPSMGVRCERHCKDGDEVLVNRQPTLHKPSIQRKTVRIWESDALIYALRRTLDTNQVVTTAFNLDYDGDEMNLHLIEDQEARAEIAECMQAKHQIRSQQGSCVIFGLVQNSCMGVYRITDPKTWFTKSQFQQHLMQFQQFVNVYTRPKFHKWFARCKTNMPQPEDKINGLYSGRQLFSALLPRKSLGGNKNKSIGLHYDGYINKNGEGEAGRAVIRNSVLVRGRVFGEDVSTGKTGNLVHAMCQDMGNEITIVWLAGMQRVCNYFIMNSGQTLSAEDYELSEPSQILNRKIFDETNRAFLEEVQIGSYDMRNKNPDESRLMLLLETGRKAALNNLRGDIRARSEGAGCRRDGTGDLVRAAAKGKPEHIDAMGTAVGQEIPGNSRILGNVAHYNNTVHMPVAHGFIEQSLTEGAGPSEFKDKAIGARESLVKIGAAVPAIGYYQSRLARSNADVVAKGDGSVRDSGENIIEGAFGGDGLDPAYLESNPLEFYTEEAFASKELLEQRRLIWKSRAVLYDISLFAPTVFLAPVQFPRLIGQVSDAIVTEGKPTLDQIQAASLVHTWFQKIYRLKVLFPVGHHRYNLLLDTMLRDVLSPWCIAERWKWTEEQLEFALEEIQRKLFVSMVKAGDAVGMIASQSLGAPATQMTLNSFHFSGQQQGGTAQLTSIVNATRKPPNSTMTVFLHPPWNATRPRVEFVAKSLVEHSLLDYCKIPSVHKHDEPWPAEDRPWIESCLARMDDLQRKHWLSVPSSRVELNCDECRESNLSAVEIACKLIDQGKRSVFQMNNGFVPSQEKEAGEKLVFYITTCDLSPYSSNLDNYVKVQQDTKDLLKDTLVRGLPRVTGYTIQSIDRRRYDEQMHKEVVGKEWVILTQGSNYDKLVEVPAVDFKNCRTSNIYDAFRNLGIQASHRWIEQTLEEAVRACESKMDTHHTKLIAAVMTYTGSINPMTRVGLSNSTNSPCRMMFENVLENVKRFGTFSAKDALRGIPECIMNGILAPVGAGFVKSERISISPVGGSDGVQSEIKTNNRSLINFASALPFDTNEKKKQQKKEFCVQNGVRQVPCGHYAFSFFQRYVPIKRNGELAMGGRRVSCAPKHFVTDDLKVTKSENPNHDIRRSKMQFTYQNHFPPLWTAPSSSSESRGSNIHSSSSNCRLSSWTQRCAHVDLAQSLVWMQ